MGWPGALVIAFLAACSPRAAPAPVEPTATAAAPPAEACRGIPVGIVGASEDDLATGNSATLAISFAGDGMGREAEWTCLDTGARRTSTHGKVVTYVRASRTELQRITIHGQPILLAIQPGGELAIAYHPCMNWMLVAAWLDDESEIDTDDAVAARRASACPRGFVEGGEIRSAADPRCQDIEGECPWRRCVRPARLHVADPATAAAIHFVDFDGQPLDPRFPPGVSIERRPYGAFCPQFDEIDTGAETVKIAPGVAETWMLRVDDTGHLQGDYGGAGWR